MATTLQFQDHTVRAASALRNLLCNPRVGAGMVRQELDHGPKTLDYRRFALGQLALDALTSGALTGGGDERAASRLPVLRAEIDAAVGGPGTVGLLADMLDGAPALEGALGQLVESSPLALTQRCKMALLAASTYSTLEGVRHAARAQLEVAVRKYDGKYAELQGILGGPALELLADACTGQRALADFNAFAAAKLAAQLPAAALPVGDVVQAVTESVSLAKVMSDLGPVCVSTADEATALLALYPGTLTPARVAECLALLMGPVPTRADAGSWTSVKLSHGTQSVAPAAGNEWVAEPFVHAVLQSAPDLDWDDVLRCIASTSVDLEAPARIAVLAEAYRAAKGAPLPLRHLLRTPWESPVSFVKAMGHLVAHPDLVSTTGLERKVPAALLPATVVPNTLWQLIDFAQALLSAHANAAAEAHALFLEGAKACPAAVMTALLVGGSHAAGALPIALALLPAAGVSASLPAEGVAFIRQEKGQALLLCVLSQYLSQDTGRMASLITLLQSNSLFAPLLEVATDPHVYVLAAISGRECGQVDKRTLQNALTSGPVVGATTANRVTLALAVVQVADTLLASPGATLGNALRQALEAVDTCGLGNIIPNTVAHAKALLSSASAAAGEDSTPEMERHATQFLLQLYKEDKAQDPITQCTQLMHANDARGKTLLSNIIRLVIEEARCVAEYPPRELQIFSRFFGQLIEANLMPTKELQEALRCVLTSIAHPQNAKVLEFGILALTVFKARVPEWPSYGKTLRQIPDLDMQIPGIMALLNQQQSPAPQTTSPSPSPFSLDAASPVRKAPGPDTPGQQGADGEGGMTLHQHDIRSLLSSEGEVTAPPVLVQDRINFIVGNTDPTKLDESARELRELLSPDRLAHFSEYFVVKRIALEPNYHKMYTGLLERLQMPELDERVTQATLTACKRLLASDKIRTASGDRSLLKALGMWLGATTLARNRPILAREFEFRDLIPHAIAEGKLIAVVPFVAKVVETGVGGQAFAPPNPWTMAALGQLVELYHLPDLKITLRFEVEVLCKNIGVNIADVIQRISERAVPHGRPTLAELKNKYVDVDNSYDFRRARDAADQPRPTKLQADATPYQPKVDAPALQRAMGPPRQAPYPGSGQEQLPLPEARAGPEIDQIPAHMHDVYRSELQRSIERTFVDLDGPLGRSVSVSCAAAREITVKDFATEPDNAKLRTAAVSMARALAVNMVTVFTRELLTSQLKRNFANLGNILPQAFLTPEVVEGIVNANTEPCLEALAQRAAVVARQLIETDLAPVLTERTNAVRGGMELPLPEDHRAAAPFLQTLPETLRPRGALEAPHLRVYQQFEDLVQGGPSANTSVDQIRGMLLTVEQAAQRHYRQCPPSQSQTLSLTEVSFTKTTMTDHHRVIRETLIGVNHQITESNAAPLLTMLFQRIMDLAEAVQRGTHNLNTPEGCVQLLLHEVCLFVLQAAREKGQGKAVAELTRLFLTHPRRWHNKELATNLIRLRVIDVSEFDRALTAELRELPQPSERQAVIDFAGHIVQRCLIDETLTTVDDLDGTLKALEDIARSAPGVSAGVAPATRKPTQVKLQPINGTEHRAQVEELFNMWIEITDRRNETQPQQWQPQALQFVSKLQEDGMLKVEGMIDKFFGLLAEISVERFATQAMLLEQAATELPAGNHGVQPEATNTNPALRPPASRLPHDAKLFGAVDAFSDLVVILVKCCTYRGDRGEQPQPPPQQAQQKPEVALVSRLLTAVVRVVQANHDQHKQGAPQTTEGLPEGAVWQESFMQQPYLRIVSNLLINFSSDESCSIDMFSSIANAMLSIAPQRVPGFTFAWLELLCHRTLLCRLLKVQQAWPHYFKVLQAALRFVGPLAQQREMPPAAGLAFKSVLKLLLLLLHDFPEFLLAFHQPLCEVIPPCCVQMRNIVLAAFPKSSKLPDPFSASSRIDQMPEMAVAPMLVFTVLEFFKHDVVNREQMNTYVREKTPANYPKTVAAAIRANGKYNMPVLNGVVLFACISWQDMMRQEDPQQMLKPAMESSVMTLLADLLHEFDNEGRFHVINACVNQLRHPNSHTQFFSHALLSLFRTAAPHQEHIQEITTRILAERLMASRPHPWGLLITFIEIVKNPVYDFWSKPFIRCSRDIERMFETMGQSVAPNSTPTAAAAATGKAAP